MNTTAVDLTCGFQAQVKQFRSFCYIDIRRFYSDGDSLLPGVPGVTLPRMAWDAFRDSMLNVFHPMCRDVEIGLGDNRAIGKRGGARYLCRYRPSADKPLNYSRDYVVLAKKMMNSILTASPLLDVELRGLESALSAEDASPPPADLAPPPVAEDPPPIDITYAEDPHVMVPPTDVLKRPTKRRLLPKQGVQSKKQRGETGDVPPLPQPNSEDTTETSDKCSCGALKPVTNMVCVDCSVLLPQTQEM